MKIKYFPLSGAEDVSRRTENETLLTLISTTRTL